MVPVRMYSTVADKSTTVPVGEYCMDLLPVTGGLGFQLPLVF